MNVVSCPHCRGPLSVDPAHAGRVVACPHCRGPLTVPGPAVPPPLSPPLPPPPGPAAPFDFAAPPRPAPARPSSAAPAEVLDLDDAEEAPPPARGGVRGGPAARPTPPRGLLAFAAVVFLLLGGFALVYGWSVRTSTQDAREVDAAKLKELTVTEAARPWVRFTPDRLTDTGLAIEQRRRGGTTVKGRFFVAQVGDQFVVVKLNDAFEGPAVVGEAEKWSDPLDVEALEKVQAQYPNAKGRWLPYQVTADHGGTRAGATWMVIGGVLALAGLGTLVYAGLAGGGRPVRYRRH